MTLCNTYRLKIEDNNSLENDKKNPKEKLDFVFDVEMYFMEFVTGSNRCALKVTRASLSD